MGRLCNHWWVERAKEKQRGREEAKQSVESNEGRCQEQHENIKTCYTHAVSYLSAGLK